MSIESVDWGIVYSALIHAVKSNSGIGFANSDQGHPAYAIGSQDGQFDEIKFGDSPDKNKLFNMLRELSLKYGGTHGPRIDDWQTFCKMAYDAYLHATKQNR